jgi:hypothetical protein
VRGYKETKRYQVLFLKNLGKALFYCSTALRGSRQTIATIVAHREPWGVEKGIASKGLSILQKLQQINFQRIGFLDFVFLTKKYF